MGKKVIITGSTGMVGQGVLLECLADARIEKVLMINRSSLDIQHPKLEEILLKDFTQIAEHKNNLVGYDACFFCMGVSSIGMDEEKYSAITFDTVKAFVDVLIETSPQLVFNYVSGTGTDSSEKGKTMWARVKGKTENYVLDKGFANAYAFRPGFIIPEKGIKSKTGWYNTAYVILRPFFGLLKKSKSVTTTTRIGIAMIKTMFQKPVITHLENKDLNEFARV